MFAPGAGATPAEVVTEAFFRMYEALLIFENTSYWELRIIPPGTDVPQYSEYAWAGVALAILKWKELTRGARRPMIITLCSAEVMVPAVMIPLVGTVSNFASNQPYTGAKIPLVSILPDEKCEEVPDIVCHLELEKYEVTKYNLLNKSISRESLNYPKYS